MRAVVVLDHRFQRTPDGTLWTDGPFGYSFFERYLTAFDGVRIAARARDAKEPQEGWRRVNGLGVELSPIPYYEGVWQYARRCRRVTLASRRAVCGQDAVILRAPSQAAVHAGAALVRGGVPFGVEVTGDPYDALARGAHPSSLRAAARLLHTRALRKLCRSARATAYVTEWALQLRYPPAPDGFSTHYSSVELPEEAFVTKAPEPRRRGLLRLISVGSMEHGYKGFDVLLEAIARLDGSDLRLDLVGDGRLRAELERGAARLGIEKRLRFVGRLPSGPGVRAALDEADLFVLPSRQEGLPRALLEAMARGLPAVATRVGGVAELAPEEELVPAGDASSLARRLRECGLSGTWRRKAGERNLRRAREYREEALRPRRESFYRAVRERTEKWLRLR